MTNEEKFAEGEILCVQNGDGSDRYIVGHFRVRHEMTFREWNIFREFFSIERGDVDAEAMLEELCQRGWIEAASPVRTVHANISPNQ